MTIGTGRSILLKYITHFFNIEGEIGSPTLKDWEVCVWVAGEFEASLQNDQKERERRLQDERWKTCEAKRKLAVDLRLIDGLD